MNRPILALVALAFVFLNAGCGQSGPLYIPGDPSEISQPPPPDEEGDDGEEGEDDNDAEKQ